MQAFSPNISAICSLTNGFHVHATLMILNIMIEEKIFPLYGTLFILVQLSAL
jgi:hypothetical protein